MEEIIYKETPVTTRLTDTEMKEEALLVIKNNAADVKTIARKIARKATDLHLVTSLQENVVYKNLTLTEKERLRLEKLLCDLIVEKQIFYSFTSNLFYPRS